MSKKIASLFVEIGADTTKLDDGLKRVKTGTSGAADGFKELTGISFGAVAAFTAIGKGLVDVTKAAMESQKADANLEATLKSTKGAVGMTADEIKRLTFNLSDMSGQDDEAIQNAEAMLLTFTKIGKDVFPQASLAMVNMAAKFGSLDAASIQLGKALNDPIGGVTALRRVGVMLTDEQETQIKKFVAVNDIASAQGVILGELQTEFGGLAEAMGQTFEGKLNRLNVAFGNLKETIGGQLLPVLSDAADGLSAVLNWSTKLENVLADHSKAVIKTAGSYDEYVREMARAQTIADGYAPTQININALVNDESRIRNLATKAVYDNERANAKLYVALQNIGVKTEENTTTGNEWFAALGGWTQASEEQARALSFSTGAMAANTAATALNAQGVTDLVSKYGSLNTAQLYNILVQGMDREAALKLGEAMGVISPQIIAARDAADSLNSKYQAGAINAAAYAGQAEALAAAIAKLQDKSITITTYYRNDGTPSDNLTDPRGPNQQVPNTLIPGATGSRNIAPNTRPDKLAGGGSWIIPPGFYENYPVGPNRASSGERVTVTPKDAPMGGGVHNYNITANDPYATAAAIDRIQKLRGLQ